jgi:lipoprotein-releasing system ATP-binding protein|tara:strand:- start:299 stop:958 length:660 start_codon:yes stop_codon:yes gene_type:complete
MNKEIISIESIDKSFGEGDKLLQVFKNFSLSLHQGETIALVGASGSGKSTLLHIVCGLDRPDSGSVKIQGIDITELNYDERSRLRNTEIGFVYQFHHLLPDLTALENIALPALLAGTNQAEAFQNSSLLLEQVNLFGKENNTPNELSGGERQRVAIARAMSNNPSCLIMDEPTGNLDTKNVENFMTLLMDMVSMRNVSLLIATHDTKVSSRLDRLLSLE